jgi:hypothetical protein
VSLLGLWPAEGRRSEDGVISSPIKRYAKCAMAPPKNGRLSEQRGWQGGPGVASKTVGGGWGGRGRGGSRSRGLIKDFGGGGEGREKTMSWRVVLRERVG